MKKILSTTIIILMIFGISNEMKGNNMKNTIYDYKAITIDGREISLSEYKDKVVLIVNVASKCGFTKQYKGLQELYMKYKDKGFEILGFPCNQFMNQEPGTNKEISEFCQLNFGVSFQLFDKINVNGDDAHPLYKYLVSEKGGLISDSIKWNFTKFLVGKNGVPFKRYAPQTEPESISSDIEKLLKD